MAHHYRGEQWVDYDKFKDEKWVDYDKDQYGQVLRGEHLLDKLLEGIDKYHQEPFSQNNHSVYNLRHYLAWGGHLRPGPFPERKPTLVKPEWVIVINGNDFCKECQRFCNDGHFQCKGHRRTIQEWHDKWEKQDTTIRAYLERIYGPYWHDKWEKPPPPPPPPGMMYVISGGRMRLSPILVKPEWVKPEWEKPSGRLRPAAMPSIHACDLRPSQPPPPPAGPPESLAPPAEVRPVQVNGMRSCLPTPANPPQCLEPAAPPAA